MPYVAIPSNLKNVDSVSLELLSPEEMSKMSYGEVLTAETINYRTGTPQMNGLFCQAIFGPIKDWECACGKYKRYRYSGVICDKCGVEVTHSSVRRERMGHITLAAPCVHPWFLRVIPSRVALLLNMKAADISRVTYFSAYVITEINEDIREEYLSKIEKEALNRIKTTKSDYDKKFDELSRQYQIDKSNGKHDPEHLKTKYETDKEILKSQQAETVSRIETISEVAKKELAALNYCDVITEVMYQELAQKFGPTFKAEIGAEAIESLLKKIDLEAYYTDLKDKMINSKGQAKKKYSKRFKLVKSFLHNKARPEWMILRRVMVLPPDLRPMLQLDGGRFAASDLNELYRRLINRNNRLRKLIQIGAPEVILRNEKRMLQEAIEALIDNSARGGRQVMASTGAKRPLKSLTDILKGKQGRFRQNLLGKRVDYSGRSVVIIGPHLKLDQCGLPKEMALELFKPFLMGRIVTKSEQGLLSEENQAFNVHSARRLIETKKPIVYDILDEVIQDKFVLLNRAPTLHRLSFMAFKPVLVEGKAIRLHPLVCKAFNADFDGDQMAVHLPITVKGQEEAKHLMVSTKNLLKPASGEIIMIGDYQDVMLGVYYLTRENELSQKPKVYASEGEMMMAFDNGKIGLNDLAKVRISKGFEKPTVIETTAGRIVFNRCFPEDYKFINHTLSKKAYGQLVNSTFFDLGQDIMAKCLDKLKDVAFEYVTRSGISMSCYDLVSPDGKHELLSEARDKVSKIQAMYETKGLLTEKDRHRQIVNVWRQASEEIAKRSEEYLDTEGNAGMMIKSGAKGNISQLNLMVGIRGLSVDAGGRTIELPAQHGYLEGLTGLEYFVGMKGQRKGQADLVLKTADAGYLTRRLVDIAQNMIIMADDCGTQEGILYTKENDNKMGKTMLERVYGRYLLKDVEDVNGKVVAHKGALLDRQLISELENYDIEQLWIRSSTKCNLPRGICQKCYGIDFSTHQPVKLGITVGIIAAQSLGEPSTQLTISSKHSYGVVTKSDITTGLPRVEEIFEARVPKYIAPMVTVDGVVEKVTGNIDDGYEVTISSKDSVYNFDYNAQSDNLLVDEGAEVTNKDTLFIQSTGEAVMANVKGKLETVGNQLVVRQTAPEVVTYKTIPGVSAIVKEGDKVKRGQAVAEGALDLQSLLDLVGLDSLQEYVIRQLTDIYVSNGITVNEKHIEVIIKQMCSRVQIVDPGDSDFINGDLIGYSVIATQNKHLAKHDRKLISFKRVVTGISKASLSTESFLSAASFQETARVLVEAVISGRRDNLLGLKENVILGQLIPAGTGFDENKVLQAELQEEFEELEVIDD
ncbi:MAG: DNA-directed RNA polymerase subunit beta' [Patescibacteria group bacterium]